MAVVDYERVVLRLKEHVLSRRSHGQGALLERLAELEVECELPESEALYDARPRPIQPASESPDRTPAMATH